jgi:hypothetical protein
VLPLRLPPPGPDDIVGNPDVPPVAFTPPLPKNVVDVMAPPNDPPSPDVVVDTVVLVTPPVPIALASGLPYSAVPFDGNCAVPPAGMIAAASRETSNRGLLSQAVPEMVMAGSTKRRRKPTLDIGIKYMAADYEWGADFRISRVVDDRVQTCPSPTTEAALACAHDLGYTIPADPMRLVGGAAGRWKYDE